MPGDGNLPSGYQYFEDPVSWMTATISSSLSIRRISNLIDISRIEKSFNLFPFLFFLFSQAIGGGLQQSDFCPTYTTIFRFEVDEDIKVSYK